MSRSLKELTGGGKPRGKNGPSMWQVFYDDEHDITPRKGAVGRDGDSAEVPSNNDAPKTSKTKKSKDGIVYQGLLEEYAPSSDEEDELGLSGHAKPATGNRIKGDRGTDWAGVEEEEVEEEIENGSTRNDHVTLVDESRRETALKESVLDGRVSYVVNQSGKGNEFTWSKLIELASKSAKDTITEDRI